MWRAGIKAWRAFLDEPSLAARKMALDAKPPTFMLRVETILSKEAIPNNKRGPDKNLLPNTKLHDLFSQQESAQTNRFSHGIFNLDLGWPYKLM